MNAITFTAEQIKHIATSVQDMLVAKQDQLKKLKASDIPAFVKANLLSYFKKDEEEVANNAKIYKLDKKSAKLLPADGTGDVRTEEIEGTEFVRGKYDNYIGYLSTRSTAKKLIVRELNDNYIDELGLENWEPVDGYPYNTELNVEEPKKEEKKEKKSEKTSKKSEKKETEKTSKTTKKEKDPNAPKKPTTAFFAFSGEKRAEVKAENPELKPNEIASKLGAMWKEMSEDEKKPYNDMVAKDKKRYEEEMKSYGGSDKSSKKEEKKGSEKEKDSKKEIKKAPVKKTTKLEDMNGAELYEKIKSLMPNLDKDKAFNLGSGRVATINSSNKKTLNFTILNDIQIGYNKTGEQDEMVKKLKEHLIEDADTDDENDEDEEEKPTPKKETPKKEQPKKEKKETLKKENKSPKEKVVQKKGDKHVDEDGFVFNEKAEVVGKMKGNKVADLTKEDEKLAKENRYRVAEKAAKIEEVFNSQDLEDDSDDEEDVAEVAQKELKKNVIKPEITEDDFREFYALKLKGGSTNAEYFAENGMDPLKVKEIIMGIQHFVTKYKDIKNEMDEDAKKTMGSRKTAGNKKSRLMNKN